jgi:phage-related minor tail protein
MEEEIRQIITAKLSAEVGERLRVELDRLYKAEKEFEKLKELHASTEKELSRMTEMNNRLDERNQAIMEKHIGIANREFHVSQRERDAKVFEAETMKTAAEKSLEQIYSLTAIVFRNQMAKTQMYGTAITPAAPGQNVLSAPVSETTTTTFED